MKEPKIEKIKIGKFDSIVMTDEDSDCTTVCYNGEGGAIISHKDREEAIKRYGEAMELAESVNKLLYFKRTNEFPN